MPETGTAADEAIEVSGPTLGETSFEDARSAGAESAVDAGYLAGDAPAAKAAGTKRKRWYRKKPVKRSTIFIHRWLSLVLGIVLLVITTSGAVVVFSPEWQKWTNGDLYAVSDTHSDPVGFGQAIATVEAAHPGFEAGSVNLYSGLIEVTSVDEDKDPGYYGVDAGTGELMGHGDRNRGFMAFMNQVHECFFTCEEQPGYVALLNDPVPTLGMSWLTDVTWSGVILGFTGLLVLFLGISGIWLWWPTLKRFSHGFRVRWSKGRYARDYDLHQVIGMAAVPFLLMWGLTGASFEFHWVNTAWYAVTGGHADEDDAGFSSTEVKNDKRPDIGLDAAITAARTKAGDEAELVYASLPAKDDATSVYSFFFAKGFDQYQYGAYPGEYGVDVDRHDATRMNVSDYGHAETLSNQLLDSWGAALFHYGQSVNGWWRIIWFTFGLTPLLLAVTGVSTWLAKRSVKKNRKKARATRTIDVTGAKSMDAGSTEQPGKPPAVRA